MQLRLEQVSVAAGKVSKKGLSAGAYCLLREISFDVAKGDRIAIVGASGAGKTTLLRLLNRLNDPTEGTIQFNGQRFQEIPVLQLRQQILFVPQEPKLLGMTVREALAYPLKLRGREIDRPINDMIDRLKIPRDWLDRTELELSTGERQWIAIARALIVQPAVLLLDEPIAHLDANRSDALLEILAQIDCTVLAVVHQFEWAAKLSDASGTQGRARVLQLQRGELVRDERSDRVNWQDLKAAIGQAEAEDAAEWD